MKKRWADVKAGDRVVITIGDLAPQRHWDPPMVRMWFNLVNEKYSEDVYPDAEVEVLEEAK